MNNYNQNQFFNNNFNNNMNKPFLNEFNQLKEYYNFRLKFKKLLNKGQNNDSFIQNTFYLIDNNWFQKWKKYVGYDNIKDIFGKNNYEREICDKDYIWIEPIIKQNSEENIIAPFDYQHIYYNGKINVLSYFIIIDNNCYDLFNLQNGNNLSNGKTYPLKFLKGKVIVLLTNTIILILFKENNIYFELLFLFDIEENDKDIFLNFIKDINIITWLKENNFDLYSTEELERNVNNCKFRIVNKTFKLFKDKIKNVKNNINPQLNDKMNQTLCFDNCLSKDMKDKLKQQTILNMQYNNNYNNIINQNTTKFYKPLYITGLQNVGQPRYMNAIIQCLSNIKPLSTYYLNNYGNFNIITQPLSAAYSTLLYELFNSKINFINPTLFSIIIIKLFKYNDSIENFIFLMIEKLHKELLFQGSLINSNISIDMELQEKDSQDELKTFKKFINEFNSTNKTIISNTFYGIYRSTTKCNCCGRKKYSFQTFNLFIFELKKVKQYKQNKNGIFYQNINIYDAFLCDQKEEILNGDNKIYCNNCKLLREWTTQQSIYGLPSIIIIVLNYQDYNENFEFPEILDFSNNDIIINPNSYHKYYLCCTITYIGDNNNGNFFGYCRNERNSDFVCYNDTSVYMANIQEAMGLNNSNNKKQIPYILFYHFFK